MLGDFFLKASERIKEMQKKDVNVWDALETPQTARLREAEAVLVEAINKWTKGANADILVNDVWKALKLVRKEQK